MKECKQIDPGYVQDWISAPEYNESYETFFKYTGVSSIRTKKISALPTVTLQVIRTNKQDNIR